jgi:hypothetical protein
MSSDPDFTPLAPAKPAAAIAADIMTPEERAADIAKWKRLDAERANKRSARHVGTEWEDVLKIARESLPEEAPPLPYDLTPEGQRMARFRQLCPVEFMQKVDRTKLKYPAAYDRATAWNGSFRGPVLFGEHGSRKTGAAWSVLGRLFVNDGREFAWWPVKKLVSDLEEYEQANMAEAFWRKYSRLDVLMVDDIDKINWSFPSQPSALFAFYDWIYRDHRPCITTTNKDRAWWTERMGDAFARRLFEDAHFEVKFNP